MKIIDFNRTKKVYCLNLIFNPIFFCYCFSDSNFIKWMLGVSLMHTFTNVSLIKGFWGHRRGEHSFLKFETPFLATCIHSFLATFSLGIHIQKINVDAKTVTISANMFKGKLRHIGLNTFIHHVTTWIWQLFINFHRYAHINLYIKLDHIDHTLKTFTILQKYEWKAR